MLRMLAFWTVTLVAPTGASDSPDSMDSMDTGVIEIRAALATRNPHRGGRTPILIDSVEARLAAGTLQITEATAGWTPIEADAEGRLGGRNLSGGYALARVLVETAGAYMLEARGHRHVYLNGIPRAGDVYDTGLTRLPVPLVAGPNELLFKLGRGGFSARLVPVAREVYLETKDSLLPDLLVGEPGPYLCAVRVGNASPDWKRGCVLIAAIEGGEPTRTELPDLSPFSVRKLPFSVLPGELSPTPPLISLELLSPDGSTDSVEFTPRVREPAETHTRTFISSIDGSVQHFAVTPGGGANARPALVLTLHGAGVEALGQAAAYASKDWCQIVAPTNRRPFGFDWEDWGRIDAIEVLNRAEELFGTDPRRTYLTGHSMGGHGTWNLGAHLADRFAAIAPSAGWTDFWSYAGGATFDDPSPGERSLERAANASRTLLLERNFALQGVYVLHGDQDDNVPVGQARAMRTRLAAFHPNFAYHERKGAGHWWGNQCVDWPPLFQFLRQNTRPDSTGLFELSFQTVHPGIQSRCHWIEIETQQASLEVSSVQASLDPDTAEVKVDTQNVARLSLLLDEMPAPPRSVVLDGQRIENPGELLAFERDRGGDWRALREVDPHSKNPGRMGPFKEAFRNRMLFVYGTGGTGEQNAWAYAKARYDAETFLYRGNGSVELVPDSRFNPAAEPDRNVILYGNQDQNSAWDRVIDGDLVEIGDGFVRVGERRFDGDQLALLLVRPRRGSDRASVGVVAGTGLPGLRLTNQLPYFVSGVAYPDFTILSTEMLEHGSAGILAAGFFGPDWEVQRRD